MDTLLSLLKQNARFSNEQLAAMTGTSEAAVAEKIEAFEKSEDALLNLLNQEKIDFLKTSLGDFNQFIENVIESEVAKANDKKNALSTTVVTPNTKKTQSK